MDKKRDRVVKLFLHRSSKNVLLFPYVCYMAGEAAASGDAVEVTAPSEPTVIGLQSLRLLRASKRADVDAMKIRRMEQLRRYWRGEPVQKGVVAGQTWNHLMKKYPALAKGPGTFLRQFSVCQIVERDGWKYRKVIRVVPSGNRGCSEDGDVRRIPVSASPKEFARQVLEFVSE